MHRNRRSHRSQARAGVYVFDVVLPSGEKAVIALDSGAGVCVWPESWKADALLEKRDENL